MHDIASKGEAKMSKAKLTVYFRDNMKAVIDADKVAFVDDKTTPEAIWGLLGQGLRIVRWESVNYAKVEVFEDDAE